jgi:hypothetical protein
MVPPAASEKGLPGETHSSATVTVAIPLLRANIAELTGEGTGQNTRGRAWSPKMEVLERGSATGVLQMLRDKKAPQFKILATGKSPEPADKNVCATRGAAACCREFASL